MIRLTSEQNAILLPVKVVPGASRTRYMGEWDGRAKIAVAAPPEKGKANKALTTYLAKRLGIGKKDVTVVMGLTSTAKTVRIERATIETVRYML